MQMAKPRVIVVPVDDTDGSQRSFEWTLTNFLKEDDEVGNSC